MYIQRTPYSTTKVGQCCLSHAKLEIESTQISINTLKYKKKHFYAQEAHKNTKTETMLYKQMTFKDKEKCPYKPLLEKILQKYH